MTVRELIEALRSIDPDGNCLVYTHDDEGALVAFDPCNVERMPVAAHDRRGAIPSWNKTSEEVECIVVL